MRQCQVRYYITIELLNYSCSYYFLLHFHYVGVHLVYKSVHQIRFYPGPFWTFLEILPFREIKKNGQTI